MTYRLIDLLDITEDWRTAAACRTADPALFFATDESTNPYTEARRICATCPARDQCLNYAVTNREAHGVWGGLSAHQRRELRAGRNVPSVTFSRCGTLAGYDVHKRRDEQPCPPCRFAHNEAARRRMAAVRSRRR